LRLLAQNEGNCVELGNLWRTERRAVSPDTISCCMQIICGRHGGMPEGLRRTVDDGGNSGTESWGYRGVRMNVPRRTCRLLGLSKGCTRQKRKAMFHVEHCFQSWVSRRSEKRQATIPQSDCGFPIQSWRIPSKRTLPVPGASERSDSKMNEPDSEAKERSAGASREVVSKARHPLGATSRAAA
jgi:hypothetical protein